MAKAGLIVASLLTAAASLALAPTESAGQRRQRDRITREEILASPHRELDLFQVVRSLRPHFLAPPPGVRSLGGAYARLPVAVYVNGVQETGLEALRTIAATHVEEVRYLDPTQSENEFGPRASGGALVIRLYKASRAAPPPAPRPARDSTPPPPPAPDSTKPPAQ
jgi:hypothetical protein